MRIFALTRMELGRIVRNRLTWLACALTALAPLAGYQFFQPTIGDSMAALYMANPLLTGGIAGTLCFAILMLVTLQQTHRDGLDALTDAIVSPMMLCAARLIAVLVTAVAASAAIGLLYLPYTVCKLEIVFSAFDYVLAVLLFLLSGPVMGAFAAATLWQLTRRLDVSLVAILSALVLTLSSICSSSFLLHWNVPLVPTLSDAFGSAIVWRTALYSRVVWLCLLGGAWLLSLLCVREYGKGLFGSLLRHARRIALPLLAVALFCGGGLLWHNQPFVDHTPVNWQELQDAEPDRNNDTLTLQSAQLNVKIESYLLGTMSGTAEYHIQNSSGAAQELYLSLKSGHTVRSITANGQPIAWKDLKNDSLATHEVRCTLPADGEIDLQVEYGGMAQMWNQMEYALGADVISNESVTMTSRSLAPVVSGCVQISNDAKVSLTINLKRELTPVGSGTLTQISENDDGTVTWCMEDSGTDRLFLYAADFVCKELDVGDGTTIPFYYSKKYQSRLENGALELMEQAVQYCTKQYGSKSVGGGFQIIQTTAFNFGGFAVGNISGMGESYFSDENLNDPDKGPDSAEILAHEIIHQWWGLSATLMDMDDSAWNDEGITVYTTYRLMCQIKGAEYAQKNYVEKWENTMGNLHVSFYQRHPEYLALLPERFQSSIRADADGANWYDGNALMIYRAAQLIGEEKLDEVWAQLFTEGGTELPPYAALSPLAMASFAGESTSSFGKAFLKSYIAVCMEGAVIVLACIIFSAFASSGAPVIDPDASVVTQVWSYVGEVIFNMLVLVGLVKSADRIAKEMFGL